MLQSARLLPSLQQVSREITGKVSKELFDAFTALVHLMVDSSRAGSRKLLQHDNGSDERVTSCALLHMQS